ncbi:thioredoxin reductase, partial [Candidatus Saccharibacteria bacterium]|nr:thioredoxin reductase [Candidatus Saccharibacteria bacterium]
ELLVRSSIKASEVLQRELDEWVEKGKIAIHLATTTDEIVATDNKVSAVKVTHDGKQRQIDIDGVFVFVGLNPNTEFLQNSAIELDDQRLVKTDAKLMTSMPGVFASGDVRSGATMQIASAVGEGASAALSIREYLEDLKRR